MATVLLEQIGCIETLLMALDRSAGPADMAALCFALRIQPTDLICMSFNAEPEPVLSFISPYAKLRDCHLCAADFRVQRMAVAVLRQWCIAFATTCRRCGRPLTPCPWPYRWDDEEVGIVE